VAVVGMERTKNSILQDAFVIGSVVRLSLEKNYKLLIRGFARRNVKKAQRMEYAAK